MRLPYLQVATEVLEIAAPDLAVMLDWDEAKAGWGLLGLFKWALARCPDDAPPSDNDIVEGTAAAKLIARAGGFMGNPEAYVDACQSTQPPILERVEGGIRVCGLDRYDAAWGKNNAEEWKEIQARRKLAPKPVRNRDETGPKPEQVRDESGPESGHQIQTQMHGLFSKEKREPAEPAPAKSKRASGEKKPKPEKTPDPRLRPLIDAMADAYREIRNEPLLVSRDKDPPATARLLAKFEPDVILARWRVALTWPEKFPTCDSIASLAQHFGTYGRAPGGVAAAAPDVAVGRTASVGRCAVAGCSEKANGEVYGQAMCTSHIEQWWAKEESAAVSP